MSSLRSAIGGTLPSDEVTKQLALYVERQVKPRRADDAMRITLVMLPRWIDWRRMLTVVQPDTLIRWHCKGFRARGVGSPQS